LLEQQSFSDQREGMFGPLVALPILYYNLMCVVNGKLPHLAVIERIDGCRTAAKKQQQEHFPAQLVY
jgi:hypothetical protein